MKGHTMRRLVITNQKGGVAKTTTAVNLAVGLSLQRKRVLLIDMDPQANTTFSFIGSADPLATIYDLLINDYAVGDVIRATDHKGLDLIPSDITLAGAEVELTSAIGGQIKLGTRLSEEELPYDYVIIDTPPSLGLLTINSLAASEEVIIPVSPAVFGLKGIQQLEQTIKKVRVNLKNPRLHIAGVLVTLYDHTNVARDVVDTIQQRFGEALFKTVIPRNVKLEEAHSRTMSVFDYAPTSSGAVAYTNLVEEVMAR
jgi:chromosome partitioning protein